jgi:hypothetical protein
MRINSNGSVGIGIFPPSPLHGMLHVEGGPSTGVGVYSYNPTTTSVLGVSTSGTGVYGLSYNATGVSGNGGTYGVTGNGGTYGVYGNGGTQGVTGSSDIGSGLVARTNTGNLVEGYTVDLRKFHITNSGTYVTGSDFAEALPARDDRTHYEPGDVLVLSTNVVGTVEKTSRAYDARVAGVYSTRPGMLGAEKGGVTRVDAEDLPVAIIGIVPTKVSAEAGPIQVGDLLTTSSTPGYAMRCEDRLKCFGATLGKAMETLAEGMGVIKVLVTLR